MISRPGSNVSAPMSAFLMGSLIGLTLGLLFAPRSGRENREAVRSKITLMQQKARQKREAAMQAFGQNQGDSIVASPQGDDSRRDRSSSVL